MKKHLIYILLSSALIVFLMYRPFMPGRFDNLAVTISFMIQIFSYASLLLFPLGILWILLTRRIENSQAINKRFVSITLIILGIVTIIVSVAPFSQNNMSFAILFLIISFSAIILTYIKNNKSDLSSNFQIKSAPLYLILIPLIVFASRLIYMDNAVQFSRELAIKNSAELINKIEQYYIRNSEYPFSLQSLSNDIKPEVVGISQYYYELNGKAYNLYFKQFSDELDVDEIVMYNKFDEHRFSAHDLDILEYTGEDLALRRGDRRKFKLSAPNWIYFKFE